MYGEEKQGGKPELSPPSHMKRNWIFACSNMPHHFNVAA
jgi:hypothetical protein